MKVVVDGYPHQPGEHCASTAIRNILRFYGTEISEGMVLGLSSGLGFFYIANDSLSPSRMFHGRTAALEEDFCANTGLEYENRRGDDDASAWHDLQRQLDAGRPALLSTDTFYLGYHHTTSHFPGHRVVAVGYDEAADQIFMADRKFDEYQICSRDELRRSRNADDYPMSCGNEWIEFTGAVTLEDPLDQAITSAALKNAKAMLGDDANESDEMSSFGAVTGVAGIRALGKSVPGWKDLPDWSWSSRFAYQVVVKRGAGGSFFRSMYADFLTEAALVLPKLSEAKLPERMDAIAANWREIAAVFKDQSEREHCDATLFDRAGDRVEQVAGAEESFFSDLEKTLSA